MIDRLRVPDIEKAVRVLLGSVTPPPITVGIGVPAGWAAGSPPHLQIGWDGTTLGRRRLTARALVRVTAWSTSTSTSKGLALDAEARLCAHDGSGVLAMVRSATGLIPARDVASGAELASFTVHVTARTIPLP